jgi:hypothetical protein
MIRFLALAFTFILIGCKITYQDIYGTYELQDFPKSTLIVKADSTFIFTQNYPNTYLHPFQHPDEYYFRTLGNWHAVPGTIKLIGSAETLDYKTVNILTVEPTANEKSNFKFVDEHGDNVPILFVQYSDSTGVSVLHHTMEDFDEDMTKRDNLQFQFFGYEPWTFIQGELANKNYTVELLPAFRPNGIDSLYLKLRRNVIGSKKLKFKKKSM